jgi:hypothetical protein
MGAALVEAEVVGLALVLVVGLGVAPAASFEPVTFCSPIKAPTTPTLTSTAVTTW